MTLELFRRFLVFMLIGSVLALTITLQTARADSLPVGLRMSAGGSGGSACPNIGVSEQMTGTFEFDSKTMSVSDVQLVGIENYTGCTESGTLTEY